MSRFFPGGWRKSDNETIPQTLNNPIMRQFKGETVPIGTWKTPLTCYRRANLALWSAEEDVRKPHGCRNWYN
jgi:hypothetical protein